MWLTCCKRWVIVREIVSFPGSLGRKPRNEATRELRSVQRLGSANLGMLLKGCEYKQYIVTCILPAEVFVSGIKFKISRLNSE